MESSVALDDNRGNCSLSTAERAETGGSIYFQALAMSK